MANLVCIYQNFDGFKVNLLKSYFDNEEIFCVIETNDASGTLPHLGFSQGGASLFVEEQDLEESQKILQQLKEEGF